MRVIFGGGDLWITDPFYLRRYTVLCDEHLTRSRAAALVFMSALATIGCDYARVIGFAGTVKR
jgi:hypothetical protein